MIGRSSVICVVALGRIEARRTGSGASAAPSAPSAAEQRRRAAARMLPAPIALHQRAAVEEHRFRRRLALADFPAASAILINIANSDSPRRRSPRTGTVKLRARPRSRDSPARSRRVTALQRSRPLPQRRGVTRARSYCAASPARFETARRVCRCSSCRWSKRAA